MDDSYIRFYEQVYSQDTPRGEAHGWLQWKGTDACIDLHCRCGATGHYDGEFLYFLQCPACGARYAVGQVVRLIPLTDEQAAVAEATGSWFKSWDVRDEGQRPANGASGPGRHG